jgi:serine/threonine-protein kinase
MGRHEDAQDFCPDDGTELRHIHTASSAQDKMIGRVLDGRWVIEEKIGEGGMGAVYRGQQTSVGRQVAVKTLRGALADTEEYVERFFREANVASTLNHPHCVTIYDFGQDTEDHVLYLAMEYLDGTELSERLHQGSLRLADTLTISIQICSALAAAHRANIVHRDLKPDNIFLVDVPGDELFVKVLDFGIAKNLDAESTGVTRTGQIFGTPAYMSPEQCQSADVDPRSDLYSLGVILYELVSGQPPFGADTPLKTLLAHVGTPAEPPSKLGFEVPEGVEAIIMRLLEKDPDKRFDHALEVRDALDEQAQTLADDQLQMAPTHQSDDRDKKARATTGTLVFDELAADGGRELVNLEDIQQKTEVYHKPATGDPLDDDPVDDEPLETAPVDDEQPAGDDASSGGPPWAIVAVVVVAGTAAMLFAFNQTDDQSAPKEPLVTHETSDAPAVAVEEHNPPEKIIALELAVDRIARAVDSSVRSQSEAFEATKSQVEASKVEKKARPASKRPSPPKKSAASKKDDPTTALAGVLTQAGARRVIASHNSQITACFEKGLLRDAEFGGKVEVRMVIASDGSVANTDVVKSTVDAADVESCIVARVKSWTFPETGDGRVKILTTPFSFQAPDERDEGVSDEDASDK